MNKNLAFTLIELLVVIAVIGILSGLIVVSMSGTTQKATIAKGQIFSNSLRNSLMSNLISEWKFDGDANDSWGGITASVSGSPAFSTDCIYGSCYDFDGSDDVIGFLGTSNYFSNNFTIGVWARSGIKSWHYVLGNDRYNIANAFAIVERQTSGYGIPGYAIYYDTNSGNPLMLSTSVLAPEKWKYITVTYNGTILKIYIDGEYKNQVARSGNFAIGNLYVGDDGYSGRYWLGKIDDLHFYDSIISDSEIKKEYYAGLNNLLANGLVSKQEYKERISLEE